MNLYHELAPTYRITKISSALTYLGIQLLDLLLLHTLALVTALLGCLLSLVVRLFQVFFLYLKQQGQHYRTDQYTLEQMN